MVIGDKMEEHILEYLATKPNKNKIYFNVRDIFITPKGKQNKKETLSLRHSLSTWMSRRMKDSPLIINGYDITIFRTGTPYKYLATRQ